MDFAKELADISVDVEKKLKINDVKQEQKQKQSEQKQDKIVHVKNVTILQGKYKGKLGYVKKDIPSTWVALIPKRFYQKESDLGSHNLKKGESFVDNKIKYTIVDSYESLLKIETSENEIIEIPKNETKQLYLIEVKVQIKYSPEIKQLYKKAINKIPTYTRKLILAEKKGDYYQALKTKVTEKEIVNSIINFQRMFQIKNVEKISIYISDVYNIELSKSEALVRMYMLKNFHSLFKTEEILKNKIEQIKQKYEYASLKLEVKNEESIENILNFELDKTYNFNVLQTIEYVQNKNSENFGKYGTIVDILEKGKVIEYEEEVFLGSKDVIIKNKDVMNITIRKGSYKGFKPKILSFTPRKFNLEIEGKILTTLSNEEKGELVKPITKTEFIYNDIIYEKGFGEVVEIREDKSIKIKTINGSSIILKKGEYTNNGFYTSKEEVDIQIEEVLQEQQQQEEQEQHEEEETEEKNLDEYEEQEEEEAIEEFMDDVNDMKSSYKDVERVTFKRELSKKEEEFRKKLESLSTILKIAIDNVFPLIDEVSSIYSIIEKALKGKELEEYFTFTSPSMKYIYALVIFRYLNIHGFKIKSITSRETYCDLLEKKEYFKSKDYVKNIWYDFSWFDEESKSMKISKENISKIIQKMFDNAEIYYTMIMGPINWKDSDPLKASRETAQALGYSGPSHLEVMTKETAKGKDKNYEMYIMGKIHDEKETDSNQEISDYFNMKEVSHYNQKNVMKEKGEISRKETWEQIKKIQEVKNYIYKKFADKLKKESKNNPLLLQIIKNIRKLEELIKNTQNEELSQLAQRIQKQIEDEILLKIRQDENKGKYAKHNVDMRMELDEDELDEDELDEDLFEQEKKKKKMTKKLEDTFNSSKVKKQNIRTVLNASKASKEDVLKFLSAKPDKMDLNIISSKRKRSKEMDWDFS